MPLKLGSAVMVKLPSRLSVTSPLDATKLEIASASPSTSLKPCSKSLPST